MRWKDYNGNVHEISECMELSTQQPNCKFLLPCGICTLFSDLHTCSLLKNVDNAPTVPERDYIQGWHDAITQALNEAYTITSEDGSFKVVQVETLEGLGMSMPTKCKEVKK